MKKRKLNYPITHVELSPREARGVFEAIRFYTPEEVSLSRAWIVFWILVGVAIGLLVVWGGGS